MLKTILTIFKWIGGVIGGMTAIIGIVGSIYLLGQKAEQKKQKDNDLVQAINITPTQHNFSDSFITFAGAAWDRSDVTIWSSKARLGYYDSTSATTKKKWHISELTYYNLYDWANANYKKCFMKGVNNSSYDRQTGLELFSFDTTKTGSDLTKIYKYANDINYVKNIVFEGHSMMYGYNVSDYAGRPSQLTISKLAVIANMNVANYVISAITNSTVAIMAARKATAVDVFYSSASHVRNIIPIFIGINDIRTNNQDDLTVYNALLSYVNSVIADGWMPLVLTMLEFEGHADGAKEATRVAYNNRIKAGLTAYVVDTAAVTELTDSTNETYFQADHVHLNAVGNGKVADAIIAVIRTM